MKNTAQARKYGFSVQEPQLSFWTISPVKVGNKRLCVDLLTEQLERGRLFSGEDAVLYSRGAAKKGHFYIPDALLLNAIIVALHENMNGPEAERIEKIRQCLKQQFSTRLMTTSSVEYIPRGSDIVRHYNALTDQTLSLRRNIAGISGLVETLQPSPDKELKTLLGANSVQEVQEVYKWLTGEDTYFTRVGTKPENKVKKALVLGIGGGVFIINASNIDGRPAVGVRAKILQRT